MELVLVGLLQPPTRLVLAPSACALAHAAMPGCPAVAQGLTPVEMHGGRQELLRTTQQQF